MHIADYHKKKGGKAIPYTQPEDEESMADLMVEAEINRAIGEPNPDWIEDMLP